MQNRSIQSMQANLASSLVVNVLLWYISFLRLAHRLSATALSLQHPVRPTGSLTPFLWAHSASRALVYRPPLMPF